MRICKRIVCSMPSKLDSAASSAHHPPHPAAARIRDPAILSDVNELAPESNPQTSVCSCDPFQCHKPTSVRLSRQSGPPSLAADRKSRLQVTVCPRSRLNRSGASAKVLRPETRPCPFDKWDLGRSGSLLPHVRRLPMKVKLCARCPYTTGGNRRTANFLG